MKLSQKRMEELKRVYRAIRADDRYWLGGHFKGHRIAGKIAVRIFTQGGKV